MRLQSSFFLLLLAAATVPSYATPTRAVKRLHKYALKQSSGFARNIRVALNPVLVSQPLNGTSQSKAKPYCVSRKPHPEITGATSSDNGHPHGNNSSSSSAKPTSSGGNSATTTGTAGGSNPTQTASSRFTLLQTYQGQSFFDGWDFFTADDPTHGIVQFVDEGTAKNAGLLEVNDAGHAIMRVETTPQVQANRQSIRITTNTSIEGGLVLMDSVHMPTGCGTWPAWWSNGPNWPVGGEIDIVEGVNDYTNNQATVHTNPGCTLSSSNSNNLGISGNVVGGTNCAALETGNQGCGVRSTDTNSFGPTFNQNGGGVYAMLWDNTGVQVWFFGRQDIPDDIQSGNPDPDNWGTPLAKWAASSCDPFQFFSQHSFIFDTTLCGDWAGSVWADSGIPGQEQSCAQRTGVSTCEAFVRANGAAFKEAYWEIKSVKMYQLK